MDCVKRKPARMVRASRVKTHEKADWFQSSPFNQTAYVHFRMIPFIFFQMQKRAMGHRSSNEIPEVALPHPGCPANSMARRFGKKRPEKFVQRVPAIDFIGTADTFL